MTNRPDLLESEEVRERVMERYKSSPLVSDYFPLPLKNGSTVSAVVGECSHCRKAVARGMFRGEVREAVGNTFRVTAIGWCQDCDVLTPYLFHVKPVGEGYVLERLEERGWPEVYECKVIEADHRFPLKKVVEAEAESVDTSGK